MTLTGPCSASSRVASLQRKMGLPLTQAEEREQPPVTAVKGDCRGNERARKQWPNLTMEKIARGHPCDFRLSGSEGEDVSPSSALGPKG